MGIDIHLHLVKFDRDKNEWKEVKLYRKDKDDNSCYSTVDLYPGRDRELFNILNGYDDEHFPCRFIHKLTLPKELCDEIIKYEAIPGYYDFKEANFADIKVYLNQYPKIRNYEYSAENDKIWEKEAWKDNPVKYLVEKINFYVDFFNEWNWDYADSDIRLVYWFDC